MSNEIWIKTPETGVEMEALKLPCFGGRRQE